MYIEIYPSLFEPQERSGRREMKYLEENVAANAYTIIKAIVPPNSVISPVKFFSNSSFTEL
jgi:hypothetical protein